MTVDVPGRRDGSIPRRKFSPDEFRLAAEFMPHIVWMATPDRLIEYVNTQGPTTQGCRRQTSSGASRSRWCIPTMWIAFSSPGTWPLEQRLHSSSSAVSDASTGSTDGTTYDPVHSSMTMARSSNGSAPVLTSGEARNATLGGHTVPVSYNSAIGTWRETTDAPMVRQVLDGSFSSNRNSSRAT